MERTIQQMHAAKSESEIPSTPMGQMIKAFNLDSWSERMTQLQEYEA